MSKKIIIKQKGAYQKLILAGATNQWLYDIDKDLGRTFPNHPMFDIEKMGDVG